MTTEPGMTISNSTSRITDNTVLTDKIKDTSAGGIETRLTQKATDWYEALYNNLHWIYLLIAAPFALVMCFVVPPLSGADEWAHFTRAAEISGGKIIGQHGESGGSSQIPSSLVPFLSHPSLSPFYFLSDSKIEFDKGTRIELRSLEWTKETVIISNPFVAYPPTSYLPASLGLSISKKAGLHLISSFYLGRVFTVIAALALAATTLLLLGRGKWLAFFFLSTPAVLFVFGSYAQDAMLISYVAIAIALFSYWHRNEFSRKKKQYHPDRFCGIFFGSGCCETALFTAGLPAAYLLNLIQKRNPSRPHHPRNNTWLPSDMGILGSAPGTPQPIPWDRRIRANKVYIDSPPEIHQRLIKLQHSVERSIWTIGQHKHNAPALRLHTFYFDLGHTGY
jgi:hypothetical protein